MEMGVYFTGSLVLQLHANFIVHVLALEVVANYKLWDSASYDMIYDYSGNSNHGQYVHKPIFTDRGIAPITGNFLIIGSSLTSNPIEAYSEFTLSYWALKFADFGGLRNVISGDITCAVDYDMNSTGGHIYYDIDGNYMNHPIGTAISGWKLHTIRSYSDPGDAAIKIMDLYKNLAFLNSRNAAAANIPPGFKAFNLYYRSVLLYEVWAHVGLSSINDLNYLIYNNCPTSPSNLCLPEYIPFINYVGTNCPLTCTSNSLSCDRSLNCILTSKSECFYGLYQIETGDCIFYCPENSCSCSSIVVDSNSTYEVVISAIECTCKEGFKKISDEYVGCIHIVAEEYHKEGNVYVIDTLAEGYSFDSYGDCCVCEEGYIAVANSPISCIYMPNCLSYTKDEIKYLCSECIEGYQLNPEGQCLECSQGYEKISEDPLKCIIDIDNCLEYIEIDGSWKCEKCKYGYILSTFGICDQCIEGYLKIQGNSLLCKAEILKCIEYDTLSDDSKCLTCDLGYELSSNSECSACDYGYVQVFTNPLECAREILNCISYVLYDGIWVCSICNKGYMLDDGMQCNLCAEGYISSPADILECVPNNNCAAEDGNCSSDSNSQDQEDTNESIDEDVISPIQELRGETIQSVNTVTTSVAIASTSVSGLVSNNPNTLIFYINTINLLSFILSINVNLPFEIKKEQGAVEKFMSKVNILSYMKIGDKSPREYMIHILDDKKGFIANIIYQLIILVLIFILNAISYAMIKFAKGKIKEVSEKVSKLFTYTIYYHFIMITYLDFADIALMKILNVKYIQPKESSILNILDFNLAILVMLFCLILPVFLASFLIGNKMNLSEEEFLDSYTFLVRDYKEDLICVYFHVLFLCRRLIIALSVHLLDKFPIAQVVICSMACWIVISIQVFLHTLKYRPFKDRVLNIIFINIELAISVCYSTAGILLNPDANEEILMWIMLACMYLSYLLHSTISYYKLVKVIYPKIQPYICKSKFQKTRDISTVIDIKAFHFNTPR